MNIKDTTESDGNQAPIGRFLCLEYLMFFCRKKRKEKTTTISQVKKNYCNKNHMMIELSYLAAHRVTISEEHTESCRPVSEPPRKAAP